jgi:RNA polymerase sigma factor (sigma-70 family)
MDADPEVERVLRHAAPHVLGALVRRSGDFDACEDAVQEAMLAAYGSWPADGIPRDPTAWLITVAHRRMIDQFRSDLARVRRETQEAELSLRELEATDPRLSADEDDTLTLLFLCCHPALTTISQVALTLRAVGGLTTAQIARAFLVSEASMTQRITRAKHKIRQSDQLFRMPPAPERRARLQAVQHVLYLVFNEGYLASSGPQLQRGELATEGIRLARLLADLVPDDGETVGLLALMLLLDSRRAARAQADGTLISLDEQDRKLWDRAFMDEGIALITDSLARLPLGPYQVQAAIAALHAEAPIAPETDWAQIVALYEVLEAIAPNPMASLGQAVAHAMLHGPEAGLAKLAVLDDDERLTANHRLHAVRAHLLELLGDDEIAGSGYLTAAGLTKSETERDYLTDRAARLSAGIRGKAGREVGATRPTDSFGRPGEGEGPQPVRG